jgi:predicted enzyme related to lactoylglutathione lyase
MGLSIPGNSFVVGMRAKRGASDLGPDKENRPVADAKVVHFEILGHDQEALQRFYSDLFGWKLDTSSPGGYGMSDPAQTGIVVGVGASRDGGAGHVTGYVRVADVDATLARAAELGGKVLMPKFSPGPDAVLGVLADPEGHVLGITE